MSENDVCKEIREELFSLSDEKYRDFSSKLIPSIDRQRIIGIRIPVLRLYAKEKLGREGIRTFMNDMPHEYFEENNLHAFLIEQIKDYVECVRELDRFLPYVDNWATCDLMRPKCFKAHLDMLICDIYRWICSPHPYTVRFGIEMLMIHFLGGNFKTEYTEAVSSVRSDEYYVNMMSAWYFATALATNWEDVIGYIESGRLTDWVQNKTVRKAIESYRISDERKEYLKRFRKKGN